MKRVMLLLPLIAIAGGCVYPPTSMSGNYAGQYPMHPRPYGPQVSFGVLPVGRWDNVMMTAVGTPLFVLMMNGNTASGDVVSVTDETLRLHVASGDVDLAAAKVMRVDRVSTRRDVVKDGARGAAYGAAVVGVLGLIVGHVPPARIFAAGGIIGANQNVQDSLAAQHATIIYLARGVVPPGPGPQPTGQSSRQIMSPQGPCGHRGAVCAPEVRYAR
jgi:hypothetical protein